MDPQLTIRETEVQNVHLPSDMHAAWARYLMVIITLHMLNNQVSTKNHSFKEQQHRLGVMRVRLAKNRRARNAFAVHKQSLLKAPL